MADTPIDIEELVLTNLFGVADSRLRKFTDAQLLALHNRLCAEIGEGVPPCSLTTDDRIFFILKIKKQRHKQTTPTPEPMSSPTPEPTAEPTTEPTKEPTPETTKERLKRAANAWRLMAHGLHKQCAALSFVYTQDDDLPSPVLAPRRIKICSFNAFKLRLSEPKRKPDGTEGEATDGGLLLQHWQALAQIMGGFDIILMQEIPGEEKTREERITLFLEMLSRGTEQGLEWSYVASLPSGVGGLNATSHKEVHAAFVKKPLTIEQVDSWIEADTVNLDYSPLQLLIRDPRGGPAGGAQKYLVTSVHLPPSDRAKKRDDSLKAILRDYPNRARDRFKQAMTAKGAKDARSNDAQVIHCIVGDFNVFPGLEDKTTKEEVYGLTKCGFVATVPEEASTSSGRQNYDNILVDARTHERYLPASSVMRLVKQQKSAAGQLGLSDHNPIVLTLEYPETTSNKPATPARAARER